MRNVSMTTVSNSGGFARALRAAAEAFGRELARREPARVTAADHGAASAPQARGSGGGDASAARDFRDGFCARWRMPELR